jgi:hypothetical protein
MVDVMAWQLSKPLYRGNEETVGTLIIFKNVEYIWLLALFSFQHTAT